MFRNERRSCKKKVIPGARRVKKVSGGGTMNNENIDKELISQIKNATKADSDLVEQTKKLMKLQMEQETSHKRMFVKKTGICIATVACVGILCIYGGKISKNSNTLPADKQSGKVENKNAKVVDMDVGVSAKTDGYQSVEELEADADLIVRGVKVKQNAPVITYYDEEPISGYTLSDFCVKEVFKDEGENIQENDTISILENEFTDKNTNITYHVAGYSMMDEKNEYILYLTANTFGNRVAYYTPLAVNYGITSLGDEYKMKKYVSKDGDSVSSNDKINALRRKIREKYKK